MKLPIEKLLVKMQNEMSTDLIFCMDKSFEDRILVYYEKLFDFAA